MTVYTYKSLSNKYPQPDENNPVRSVFSVRIEHGGSIITMNREATKNEIDIYKLIKL